jgi:two-component system response regulator YesN
MDQAKCLLEKNDHYIYEVAKKVGYSNYDYFHKKFKKYTGISPKEYQSNLMKKEGVQ